MGGCFRGTSSKSEKKKKIHTHQRKELHAGSPQLFKQLVWVQTACVLITGSAAPPNGHRTVSSHRFTPPAIEPLNVCEAERAAMLPVPYLICSLHWFNWLKGKFKWRRWAARVPTAPPDQSVSGIRGQLTRASLTKTNRSGGRLYPWRHQTCDLGTLIELWSMHLLTGRNILSDENWLSWKVETKL